MRAALAEAGRPAPEFLDEGSWLRLTFYTAAQGRESAHTTATRPAGGLAQPRRSGAPTGGLNARQRTILAEWEARGQGQIRRAEYQARFEIANPTAWRDLQELLQQGLIQQVGRGPQVSYVYPAQGPESAASALPETEAPNARTGAEGSAGGNETMKR